MPEPLTLALAGMALVGAGAAVAMWRRARTLQDRLARMQQRLTALERDHQSRPLPRLAFEFNGRTREALLHLTNDGGDVEIEGRIAVEGELTHGLPGDAHAAWEDGGGASREVRTGETKTLRIAQLDVSAFPYAQWQVYAVSSSAGDGVLAVRAMHTSMIGGDPDTHAAPLFVQVAMTCSPDPGCPPPHCTIALRPFEAVRLGPV